ncbi:LacI family DNA-binding transcriptional regulator [Millisia brevis]|uniref:LacI family DNA-binding transcriptional regulator n=1 Tax=Millisia brevis TaxID=264148 RepID=UPI00082DB93A|nr:LacI family DNA-binding transcriptional regulator [Millisia brevis]
MPRSSQPRRPVTLATLAAELNVSRTTVSNAYNRPDQLSPALRERILGAAKRHGYPGPNPLARSLRTRRAGVVGVMLTEMLGYAFSDPSAVSFLAGVAESAEADRKGLLLLPIDRTSDAERAATTIGQAAVDALVIYSTSDDDPHVAAAQDRRIPLVICDQPRDVPGASVVGIDDRAAMRSAAEHLLELGHRRIGVLCMRLARGRSDGPVGPNRLAQTKFHVQRERIGGILDAVAAAGMDPAAVVIHESFDNSVAGGRAAAARICAGATTPTALLCTSDVLALGAIEFARVAGLSVPGDMSVSGFDGIEEARRAGVTTVWQNSLEKGRVAGRMILQQSHSGVERVEMLPAKLIVGRTTGIVPGGRRLTYY